MSKTNIDILGSCVLRDTIEFCRAARDNISVCNFFQSNSAVTLGSDKLSQIVDTEITENDFSQTAPVWYRWFMANKEETVYKTLNNSESKFLLTSFDECYYGYYAFRKGNLESRLCPSFAIEKNKILDKINYEYKSINTIENQDIDNLISNHLQKIRKIYDVENIILLEFYPAYSYIDNRQEYVFCDDNKYSQIVRLLCRIYSLFKTIIPEAKIIKLPENCLGDPNHKWGKGSRHFMKEVYDYIGKRLVDILTNRSAGYDEIDYVILEALMNSRKNDLKI